MSNVRFYTDIIIDGDQFSIIKTVNKPLGKQVALNTLRRIEEVIRKEMKYAETEEDNFSKLSPDELFDILRQKAKTIHDGFMKKTASLLSIQRIFRKISKKEEAVLNCFSHILKIGRTPPTLQLPPELTLHALSFLSNRDLCPIAQVSTKYNAQVKQTQVQKAREYGYQGNDFAGAKRYLQLKFYSISRLCPYIPERYLEFKKEVNETLLRHAQKNGYQGNDFAEARNYLRKNERFSNWVTQFIYTRRRIKLNLDVEATLQNIRNLSGEEREVVKRRFALLIHKFILSSDWEHFLLLKFILAFGADPNILDSKRHQPPLVWAAERNNIEAVQELIKAGADVNALSWGGVNGALSKAVIFEHSKVVELLLKNGASATINHTGKSGYTPLHRAVKTGNSEMVKLLLGHGADPHLTNPDGKTAIQLTQWYNRHIRRMLKRSMKSIRSQ